MYSLIKILIILFSVQGFARELIVVDRNLKYKLNFDNKIIRYETNDTSLSLENKKCSAHINERFIKTMNHFLETPFLNDSRAEFIQVALDQKLGFEPRFGKRAAFLLNMNDEIKKLKIEESLNCNKKGLK